MRYADKIGISIITGNRESFFNTLIESIDPDVGTIYVFNSGEKGYDKGYPDHVNLTRLGKQPVGIAKDHALRTMVQAKHEFQFILEDDIRIKDNNVFAKYVDAHLKTGLCHFNWHGHGLPNNGNTESRNDIDYGDGVSLSFYHEILGAFSFFHRGAIKQVGYHDSKLKMLNAFEHVDHTYRFVKKKLTSPYRWFADITGSLDYIEDQSVNHGGSLIRRDEDWMKNFMTARRAFTLKHGYDPTKVPDTEPEKVIERLEQIKNKYSREDLME